MARDIKFHMVQIKKNTRICETHSDVTLTEQYQRKAKRCKDRGIGFGISFMSFKNLKTAKRCFYTGITLTPDTHTIDRIDNKLPYVSGNVVACHKDFNNLKSQFESANNELNVDTVERGMKKLVVILGREAK